jgi:hypothetical protein
VTDVLRHDVLLRHHQGAWWAQAVDVDVSDHAADLLVAVRRVRLALTHLLTMDAELSKPPAHVADLRGRVRRSGHPRSPELVEARDDVVVVLEVVVDAGSRLRRPPRCAWVMSIGGE